LPSALVVMFAALCFEKEVENSAALIWLGLSIVLAFSNWPRQKTSHTYVQVKAQ